ncbi:hypothetical protein AB0L13_47525 [Saccharopolyspora shandongensis]|uniref:hypothetical protein n=1 Tax=Saccharopolyspora shandongensis TaxID=418495 RepID=UPI003430FE30
MSVKLHRGDPFNGFASAPVGVEKDPGLVEGQHLGDRLAIDLNPLREIFDWDEFRR